MEEHLKSLQKNIEGKIDTQKSVTDYYSTDGSILRVHPKAVVFPLNAKDVKSIVSFSHNLAQQGTYLPITARGKGTDQAGGALGEGLVVVTPAHLYHLLEVTKTQVRVQPGAVYGDLQQILNFHGRFIPPFPSSIAYSTIGGAIANNACGEKTVKYGCTRDYAEELKIVLSNGEQITTKQLSKRQLSRKKKLHTLEGEIYRKLDELLETNKHLVNNAAPHVTKNSAGYDLWDIKGPHGTFDLTKLIVGSQGTLGIVTEILMRTEAVTPDTSLMKVNFHDLEQAGAAAEALRALKPCALELVDYHLLEFLQKSHPGRIAEFVGDKIPKIMFLIEFDDRKFGTRKRKINKALKILKSMNCHTEVITDPINEQRLWRIRRSAAAVIWQTKTKAKALPVIEDAAVPIGKFVPFLHQAYALFDKHNIKFAVWGHAGDANFHIQPFFDLSKKSDQKKLFEILEEFYGMVIDMGGTTAGEHNDGRLRAPFLPKLYGSEVYELFRQVKHIFDPHNILNPGVKIDVNLKDIPPLLRHEYSMPHLDDSAPEK